MKDDITIIYERLKKLEKKLSRIKESEIIEKFENDFKNIYAGFDGLISEVNKIAKDQNLVSSQIGNTKDSLEKDVNEFKKYITSEFNKESKKVEIKLAEFENEFKDQREILINLQKNISYNQEDK